MGKRLIGAISVLVALMVLVPASAWAQGTTGTIRGKVIDQATGDPLAAVNVFVLETDGTVTTMGAFTNAEGDYVIINVPPGKYILRATMMGYKTYEVHELLGGERSAKEKLIPPLCTGGITDNPCTFARCLNQSGLCQCASPMTQTMSGDPLIFSSEPPKR